MRSRLDALPLDSLALADGKRGFNLDTAQQLFEALGNPQDTISAIHVAGTNGKGSVSAMIHAMLDEEGFRVGLYTSPHLTHVTERCVVNCVSVEEEEFERAVEEVFEAVSTARLQPSYFEVVTIAAFLVFSRRQLDWVVIEVGLGGRLDATNAMRSPVVSLISSIGYDHTDFLGTTYTEIAREKAGILRPGRPCFCGEMNDEARAAITAVADAIGTSVRFYGRDFFVADNQAVISEEDECYELSDLSLLGEHQKRNATLAIAAARYLGISRDAIERALRGVQWPGRLEPVTAVADGRETRVLLDAAHNVDGISVVCDYLRKLDWTDEGSLRQIVMIFSVLERKNWVDMLRLFQAFRKDWVTAGKTFSTIFTSCNAKSAVNPETLVEMFGEGEAINNPKEALSKALAMADSQTLVLITGSIYLLGELRADLVGTEFRVKRTYSQALVEAVYSPKQHTD